MQKKIYISEKTVLDTKAELESKKIVCDTKVELHWEKAVLHSSIVNEVTKGNLKPLYLFIYFFTRRFYMHKKQKMHTSKQKQKKKKNFYAHKNI